MITVLNSKINETVNSRKLKNDQQIITKKIVPKNFHLILKKTFNGIFSHAGQLQNFYSFAVVRSGQKFSNGRKIKYRQIFESVKSMKHY